MEPFDLPSNQNARRRVLAPDLEPDVNCAAAVALPVLITADIDVAEWLARVIHDRSERRAEPFVVYRPGRGDQLGLLKSLFNGSGPGRGTLFVDDVSRAGREVQEFLREALASPPPAPPVRFRVIASTSVWLFEHVEHGEFDARLFYRLNKIHIRLRTYQATVQPDANADDRSQPSPGPLSMDVDAFRKHRLLLRAGEAALARRTPAPRHG